MLQKCIEATKTLTKNVAQYHTNSTCIIPAAAGVVEDELVFLDVDVVSSRKNTNQ